MLDYDDIDEWAPRLTQALESVVPPAVCAAVAQCYAEFPEDSLGHLFAQAPRAEIIEATLRWIRSETVAAYHGTRLTSEEAAAIRVGGMLPLRAADRRDRLERALSTHARWAEVSPQLASVLRAHGAGNRVGCREGQVHFTLSKAGLTERFNHYLTHGSEFDQNVAHELLGQEGLDLLARDGRPALIQASIPGSGALDGAHRSFTVEDLLQQGEIPNLARPLLEAWSFRLLLPTYQTRSRKLDCGIRFKSVVPAAWIESIEPFESIGID